jgi:hypothetical protein
MSNYGYFIFNFQIDLRNTTEINLMIESGGLRPISSRQLELPATYQSGEIASNYYGNGFLIEQQD